jgi:hypothetical protein
MGRVAAWPEGRQEMMLVPGRAAYVFDMDCPNCGGEVEHVTGSQPAPLLNIKSAAIVQCVGQCRRRWTVTVTLAAVSGVINDLSKCGTEAGWFSHRTANEQPCPSCVEARDAAKRGRRAAGMVA